MVEKDVSTPEEEDGADEEKDREVQAASSATRMSVPSNELEWTPHEAAWP